MHTHVLVVARMQGIHENYTWTCAQAGAQAEGHTYQGHTDGGTHRDAHVHSRPAHALMYTCTHTRTQVHVAGVHLDICQGAIPS